MTLMIATVRSPEPIAPLSDDKLTAASRFAATIDAPAIATQFSLYNSVGEINADEWNSIRTADDLFMSLPFIEAIENSMRSDCRLRYVIIRERDGRPVATACLSAYSIDGASLAQGFSKTLCQAIARVCPWLMKHTMVMCGLPMSTGDSQLRFAPHADRASVLAILDRLVRQFAKSEGARLILFKEFKTEGCRDLESLGSLGYRKADSFPMNLATTRYRDFEDYLSQVKSKKRRMLKSSLKKFAKGGFRVVEVTGREGAAELYTDKVHRLYENVVNRSKIQFERLPAEFFRELARRLPDNTSYIFVYRGDEPVAFSSSVFTDKSFHGLMLGIDYEVNREHELYFNMLFKSLDSAFRRGVHDIELGQTADSTKQGKLDTYQAPLSLYVKGGRWTAQVALDVAFPYLFPPRPISYQRDEDDSEE
jgi:predicted N-acyltransferase